MEMFNRKVLKERIGHLQKNDKLDYLEQVEGYVIRKCSENGIEYAYDVMAEEMPYFKTMAYTELATCFYLQPMNYKIRDAQIPDAFHDKDHKVLDYASYFVSNITDNTANKYKDRLDEYEKWPAKDYLVILPGSNKLKDRCCLNKMRHIQKAHKGNVLFKPHPITTHQIIGEMKDFFGQENVLPREMDMYYYIQKAKKVYTTHISESAVYAAVLGKDIEPFDVWNSIFYGSFYCVSNHLFDNKHDARNYINKTFSSPKSGIICPRIDKNWKEKVDKYFEYITAKRDKYKNWFIDSRKPKNKK